MLTLCGAGLDAAAKPSRPHPPARTCRTPIALPKGKSLFIQMKYVNRKSVLDQGKIFKAEAGKPIGHYPLPLPASWLRPSASSYFLPSIRK